MYYATTFQSNRDKKNLDIKLKKLTFNESAFFLKSFKPQMFDQYRFSLLFSRKVNNLLIIYLIYQDFFLYFCNVNFNAAYKTSNTHDYKLKS